jgi:transcriptional regulator with XRE-family HTH domain
VEEAFDHRLGAEIDRLRRALGWLQDDLASLLGVSRSTVSQIEAGNRKVTAYELARLCTCFRVDPLYLLGLITETTIEWPPPRDS